MQKVVLCSYNNIVIGHSFTLYPANSFWRRPFDFHKKTVPSALDLLVVVVSTISCLQTSFYYGMIRPKQIHFPKSVLNAVVQNLYLKPFLLFSNHLYCPPLACKIISGLVWIGCGCHNVPIYRPNSNSAEFCAWVVLNYSCYVRLG